MRFGRVYVWGGHREASKLCGHALEDSVSGIGCGWLQELVGLDVERGKDSREETGLSDDVKIIMTVSAN